MLPGRLYYYLVACVLVSVILFVITMEGSKEKIPTPRHGHNGVIKAAFVMLVKADPISIALAARALSSLDSAFNHKYHYPLVVFHEGELDEAYRHQLGIGFSGNITFSMVAFSTPEFLNQSNIPETITAYSRNFSIGYRHMCRFYAGLIAHSEALKDYDWMWRIDDDSIYICPITYNPFQYMHDNGKRYGYVIEWNEPDETVTFGLWNVTNKYMRDNRINNNHMNGYKNCFGLYNQCHFWNNFEIADLRLLRSAEYSNYFDYLDKLGGIYFYRWGDALIRTLGVLMFTSPSEVHQFRDIGYAHNTACINLCNWQPKTPMDGMACNHLPTGRDASCEVPHRYFAGDPTAQFLEIMLIRAIWVIIAAAGVAVAFLGYYRYHQRSARRLIRKD